MRIVADTNIVISMLLWGKSLKQLFVLVNRRRFVLCFSPQTIDEILRVVRYPHIQKRARENNTPIDRLLDKLFALSHIVYPDVRIDEITADRSDNRILEVAVTARADCIVSGDAHLLGLGSYSGVPILKPKRFLELFGK